MSPYFDDKDKAIEAARKAGEATKLSPKRKYGFQDPEVARRAGQKSKRKKLIKQENNND